MENKNYYKKHLLGLEFLGIPSEILKQYEFLAEYVYKEVPGYAEIPFPKFTLKGLKRDNIELSDALLISYTKGFLTGYNDNLMPYIDSFANKMERIFMEIKGKGARGFLINNWGGDDPHCDSESIFASGVFEGKRYKAWNYIFDNPNAFIELFNATPESKPNSSKNIDNSSTLIDYFNNPALLESCLELLRNTMPPTITATEDELSYIGKSKGVVIVWFLALQHKGIIENSFINDIGRAEILNRTIKNLEVSESLFRGDNIRAIANYKDHFNTEIATIKAQKH